jgi:hypothetical protein
MANRPRFLCLALFLLGIAQNLSAQVTPQVQPGPNEANWKFCGSAGQILFEGLAQGSVLGEVIPGVKFTTTAGQDWLVGRWSSHQYNGKYPSGSYTSEGDAWAWLGPSQGAGVITFTNGLASYFSLFTSTIGGVTIDAYNQSGQLLTNSGFASSNTNTGTMDKLTISRPTADIKSVRVHDSGNYWVIDSICTDAPGVNCGALNVPDYKQFACTSSANYVCGPAADPWFDDPYTGGGTISAYGCGLTSLVDILRSYGYTTVDGQDLNPGTLNTWMENNDGYTSGGGVQWWAIDALTNYRLVYNNQSVLCDANAPTLYSTTLDKDLFDQKPAILRVRGTSGICGHFVVAKGKCSNTYQLSDPGHSAVTSLADAPYNNQWAGYRRFAPADGTARPIVVINMHSPADVLVTAPDGKRTGFDPTTGQFVTQIPGSSYSDEGGVDSDNGTGTTTPQYRSLQISNPAAGAYKIQLTGTGNGSYRMEIISRDTSSIIAKQNIIGSITTGSTQQFNMQYSPVQAEVASVVSPGSLIGGGNIGTAAVTANVSSTGTSASGTVMVNLTAPGRQLVRSTSIRSATFQPGVANINGNCTVNGQGGFTFSLSVVRTTSAQVTAQVLDSKGKVLYAVSGALNGNLVITTAP